MRNITSLAEYAKPVVDQIDQFEIIDLEAIFKEADELAEKEKTISLFEFEGNCKELDLAEIFGE